MIEIEPNVKLICDYLNEGKLVAIPTETVYGIAIKCDNSEAIKRLYELKQRKDKLFTMMIHDKNIIDQYALLSDKAREIVMNHFPGELTVILPVNPDFENEYFKAQDGTIGIRIPNHELMLNVLKESGPLFVTSANLAGNPECNTSAEVKSRVPGIDVVVKGKSGMKKPSTIVKIIEDDMEIIRQGDLIL